MPRPPVKRPASLVVLALAALVEGVAFLLAAAATAIATARNGLTGPSEVSSAQGVVLELVIFIVFGVALLATARGWLRGRRWARSVHVLAQLLVLVVAIPSLGAVEPVQQVVAWLATAIAAGTLVVALLPSVTRAILAEDEQA